MYKYNKIYKDKFKVTTLAVLIIALISAVIIGFTGNGRTAASAAWGDYSSNAYSLNYGNTVPYLDVYKHMENSGMYIGKGAKSRPDFYGKHSKLAEAYNLDPALFKETYGEDYTNSSGSNREYDWQNYLEEAEWVIDLWDTQGNFLEGDYCSKIDNYRLPDFEYLVYLPNYLDHPDYIYDANYPWWDIYNNALELTTISFDFWDMNYFDNQKYFDRNKDFNKFFDNVKIYYSLYYNDSFEYTVKDEITYPFTYSLRFWVETSLGNEEYKALINELKSNGLGYYCDVLIECENINDATKPKEVVSVGFDITSILYEDEIIDESDDSNKEDFEIAPFAAPSIAFQNGKYIFTPGETAGKDFMLCVGDYAAGTVIATKKLSWADNLNIELNDAFFTGLQNDREYDVWIYSIGEELFLDSPRSNCGKYKRLRDIQLSLTNSIISFVSINAEYSYKIKLKSDTKEYSKTINAAEGNIEFDILELRPGTGVYTVTADIITTDSAFVESNVIIAKVVQLAAPVIRIEGQFVKWDAVPKAAGYRIYCGDLEINTTETSYDLMSLGLESGNHTVKVRAVGNISAPQFASLANISAFVLQMVAINYNIDGDLTQNFVELGSELVLPNVTIAGKVFDGWFYNEELTLKAANGDIVEGNIVLYAKLLDAEGSGADIKGKSPLNGFIIALIVIGSVGVAALVIFIIVKVKKRKGGKGGGAGKAPKVKATKAKAPKAAKVKKK